MATEYRWSPSSMATGMTVASVLQLVGLALVAVAVTALWSWPWALLVAGIVVLLLGVALELDARTHGEAP